MNYNSSSGYDEFEEISALVKQTHLKFNDPKNDYEVNKAQGSSAPTARDVWVQKSKNLIDEINDLVNTSDKKYLSTNQKFVIPNFFEEAEMLEWAGISFGEEDNYKISKSIKRLAVMSGASRLRFMGKIYGTQKDYWLAAGTLT